MSDYINRRAAIDAVNGMPDCPNGYSDTYDKAHIIAVLEDVPSVEELKSEALETAYLEGYTAGQNAQPKYVALHESCTDCPLYDRKNYNCPRFNRVIPMAIRDAQTQVKALSLPSVQPEQSSEIQDILEYLDTVLHPIISPDHWNVYSELHDMISMLPSAQPEVAKDTNVTTNDCISRQAAIDALRNRWLKTKNYEGIGEDIAEECEIYLRTVPSAQPETKPISYLDCANAMLMMWMDEVVTDGEYNRIMDKLNAHELKKRSKNG